MIVGGGIGNMIDRIFLGYVVDFIDFTLIDFAIFNVADSFVCVGAGILAVWLLMDIFKDVKSERAAATASQATSEQTEAEPEGGVEEAVECPSASADAAETDDDDVVE